MRVFPNVSAAVRRFLGFYVSRVGFLAIPSVVGKLASTETAVDSHYLWMVGRGTNPAHRLPGECLWRYNENGNLHGYAQDDLALTADS